MREQAEARLKELRGEFEAGQARLREVELEEARLREMLLRISGAIQVLHELLVPDQAAAEDVPPAPRERKMGAAKQPTEQVVPTGPGG